MPLETQVFLLRILESGEYIRVGGSKVQKTDVRIVAATNVTLEEAVKKGKFRQDLYYRLSTVPIQVPPLRERQGDINLLFRKFAVDFSERQRTPSIQLDDKAKILLEKYHWPGNIRELKNLAEKISVLSTERLISAEDLIDYIPNILKRNLPIPAQSDDLNGNNFQEREILYKLLFDMKGDLNELKKLVFELISTNNLRVSDMNSFRQLQPSYAPTSNFYESEGYSNFQNNYPTENFDVNPRTHLENTEESPSLVINHVEDYHEVEDVEENLSLEDMEIRLITKALDKHNGKRKDAALELGISERTLYRKIDKYQANFEIKDVVIKLLKEELLNTQESLKIALQQNSDLIKRISLSSDCSNENHNFICSQDTSRNNLQIDDINNEDNLSQIIKLK